MLQLKSAVLGLALWGLAGTALSFHCNAEPGSAQSYAPPHGIVEADQYASEILKILKEKALAGESDFQKDLKDYVVVFLHEGERVPDELTWIAEQLKRSGLSVKILRRKSGSTEFSAKNIEIEMERAMSELLVRFDYLAQEADLPKLGGFNPKVSPNSARAILSKVATELKGFFGLHQGISWAMFKDDVTGVNRPLRERTIETLGSLPVAALIGTLIWRSVQEQVLLDTDLFPIAGVVAAAAFQVVAGYFDRAWGAFQIQGKAYFTDRKTIETKRSWFFLAAFSHTFFSSLLVQAALHSPLEMTASLVTHTAWNAMISFYAKALPSMWISKHQRSPSIPGDTGVESYSPMKTIALSIGFKLVYEALKYGHLLQWGTPFSALFYGLCLAGLAYEAHQHFIAKRTPNDFDELTETVQKRFRKDFLEILSRMGLRERSQCQSFLMGRPLHPLEKRNPIGNGIL